MEFSCFGLLSMTIKAWVLGFPCFVLLAIHSMEFPCYGIVAMTFISWNSMFSLTGNSLKFTCVLFSDHHDNRPGRVAQSVTCLATDACLTADPGVASSIPARSHTFVEIDHEIISTVILLLPLIYSRRVVVSYKRKYVHEFLVNRLFKPAQEKVWLGELTVPQ